MSEPKKMNDGPSLVFFAVLFVGAILFIYKNASDADRYYAKHGYPAKPRGEYRTVVRWRMIGIKLFPFVEQERVRDRDSE